LGTAARLGAGAFGLPFRGRFDMRLSLGSFLSSL
jgi:hypothetical protein